MCLPMNIPFNNKREKYIHIIVIQSVSRVSYIAFADKF